jgi:hypothetical protein
MRKILVAAVVGHLSVVVDAGLGGLAAAQAPSVVAPGKDASVVLAAARDALGGEKKLAEIRSFVATGRTRQVRGSNVVPIEFEIACQLPDRYVRKDEVPAQESGPSSLGFNGDGLIQLPAPSGSSGDNRSTTPAAPNANKARVISAKQDFAKLTLGLFATSFSAYPLSFSLAGQAEAPQGAADVVDVSGPDGFSLRLFINSQTHLPIMVSWTTPNTNVVLTDPGQSPPENLAPGAIVVQAPARPPATAPKEEQDRYAADVQALRKKTLAGARPLEHRLYFADYRDVGHGVQFPFRLRRATAGETIEETNFDGFKINPRLDPRKFDAVK